MTKATSCGGVVIFRGKILLLYKSYKNRYDGWVLPKGTVEQGETHEQTALREVKEETGLSITPDGWLGAYLYSTPYRHLTYLRFCFFCELVTPPGKHTPNDPDNDIIDCHWLTYEQINQLGSKLRSPLVLECIEAYLNGPHLSLETLRDRRSPALR